jgi:hypothetical protein
VAETKSLSPSFVVHGEEGVGLLRSRRTIVPLSMLLRLAMVGVCL